jgi:hypothetical protein
MVPRKSPADHTRRWWFDLDVAEISDAMLTTNTVFTVTMKSSKKYVGFENTKWIYINLKKNTFKFILK